MTLTEGGIELVGVATQEGADQHVGGIHQQLQFGGAIQRSLMVHQLGQIFEAGVMEQDQRFTSDPRPDKALTNGR